MKINSLLILKYRKSITGENSIFNAMKSLLLSLLFFLLGLSLFGQSLTDLRVKKINSNQIIHFTSKLIKEALKDEKASLGKLVLIRSQIDNRNQFIENITNEINLLNYYIDENSEVSSMLSNDLVKLKEEYAGMIRFAQKNRNSYDMTIFLLSSENINQAYKRMLYLKQYASFRKSQADIILTLNDLLDKKVLSLKKLQHDKAELLVRKNNEAALLASEKKQQDNYYSNLKKRQKELKRKLRDQQKIQNKLTREIERLIEEETKKSGVANKFKLTPEQQLISSDFEKNKGRIPWPLERGVITEHFGVHAHAVLKNIKVKSNGIAISSQQGTKARAVFTGEVSRVFAVSGGNMAVIIRHGNFLSVYSNLKEVFVKAGQMVKTKQEIGVVFTNSADGNRTVLKFQVWKESKKLNPENWISR